MPEPSDILERAKNGDTKAFQELVRPHLDSLRRFARSFCKSESDADDLTQDALIKAYRAIGTFDGRSSLTTWLYTIAKRQFIDYRRGKLFQWRRRESDFSEDVPGSSPNAEGLVFQRERVELVWSELRKVDQKYRTPLVLAELEGLAYEEIAAIEGIPLGTVRSRISRGKEQLRALLSAVDPDTRTSSPGTPIISATSQPMTRELP